MPQITIVISQRHVVNTITYELGDCLLFINSSIFSSHGKNCGTSFLLYSYSCLFCLSCFLYWVSKIQYSMIQNGMILYNLLNRISYCICIPDTFIKNHLNVCIFNFGLFINVSFLLLLWCFIYYSSIV